MNLSSAHEWPSNRPAVPDRRALTRVTIVAVASIGMCVMAMGLTLFGLLPWREVGVVTVYCALGNLTFYWILRSGRAARWRDPSCIFPHHLFLVSILLLGCMLIPQDRSASLQLFMLIWAFNAPLLSSRQLTTAASIAIVGVLASMLVNMPAGGDGRALHENLLAILMTVVYVPGLVALSRAVRKIRERQIGQRTALADALAQLRRLSERDVLTGASNRRHALDVLVKEAARQNRTGRAFSVGMLDLDYFKRINDTHGHAVGDDVLMRTVGSLTETLPAPFTVARWGGEEFLVVMPETPLASAADWMHRSRSRLASHDWSDCAPGLQVDVSVGVAEHLSGHSTEATIERADRALYRAKAEGRGRVVEQTD